MIDWDNLDQCYVVVSQYHYVGLTGTKYHPVFNKGKWYLGGLSGQYNDLSFYDIVYMCKIPDDEALMLRLRYGG